MRRRTLAAALLAVTSVLSGAASAATPLCDPAFEHVRDRRTLPHAYHDQGVESLRALYPEHVLLVQRRSSRLGDVLYSLLVYKEDPLAEVVHLGGVAVVHPDAWSFDMTCTPGDLAGGLVTLLEEVAALGREP